MRTLALTLFFLLISIQPLADTEDNLTNKDISAIRAVVDNLPPIVCSWNHTMDNEGKIILALKDSGKKTIGLCFESELRKFECDFFK